MVSPHTNGCPEPEVLAAYVDRGLSLSERGRVDAHLASCPQCIALVAGVARTVEELSVLKPGAAVTTESTPLITRRSVAGALAAAAAVIAVLATPALVRPWLERDSGLVSLVESVGEQRSVLGRLTGGFPHAPLGEPSAGGQDGRAAGTDRVQLTAGRIRESFGERKTPSQLHALGLSQLLAGQYDDAALSLLAASREQPANAQYLSDVAAVQIERARRGLRPDDLPRALAAADRARRLDPSLKEAWFNRALAASALSLTSEAKSAWTEYLKRDSTSPWAGEARKRLDELSKPTQATAWTVMEGRLQSAFDASTADDAVRAQTTEARRFIEHTLILDWSNAVLDGGSGATERERLRTFADAMSRIAGDALYRDAVDAIDRAETRDESERLAKAHKTFAAASAVFDEDRFAAAAPGLTAVRTEFIALGSPFATLADVELAAINYVASRYDAADETLANVATLAASKNYRFAGARATWFRGLIAFAQGRIADAQDYYEQTLATFDSMGDVEQRASAHSLLAALNFYLGDKGAEWQHRQAALEGLAVSTSHRFKHLILASAAASVRFEAPETALVIQDAVLANAREWRRDAAIADVLAQRSSTLISLGRTAEGEQALNEAKAHLAQVSDESFRQIFKLPVLAAESDLMRSRHPQAAATAATEGLDLVRARGDRTRIAQFALRLAKANIVWGHISEAEIALTEGINAFDAERAALTDELRVSATDEAWQLFDTAMQLAIHKGQWARAFALAEAARARSLVERRLAAEGPSLDAAQRQLARGEVVLALNQFDDELAVWAISRRSVRVITRPLKRSEATRLIGRQQLEIAQGSAAPEASALLYDQIIRPLSAELNGATRVTVIPDVTYQDVSFAALWNKKQNRFLVEDTIVTGAPSFWALAVADRSDADRSSDVLVMAPNSQNETTRAIAGMYGEPLLLQGRDATRSRFLSTAPGRSVVHLSTTTLRNDAFPLLSGLKLSDEPGRRHSGLLFGREIASQSLSNTHLVVIDEVDDARGNRGEGTLSMARAFMAAGVPAVLGTLPGADETASRDLMIGFHREMRKDISAEEALHTVQRNAIKQNGGRLGAWTALVLYGSDR
jgi:CHAT domain-containing protein/tetratricopeptide (TPR) repeat protein